MNWEHSGYGMGNKVQHRGCGLIYRREWHRGVTMVLTAVRENGQE